jgi:hypothetical protein
MGIEVHPTKSVESVCRYCPWQYQEQCLHPKCKQGECPLRKIRLEWFTRERRAPVKIWTD